MLDPRARRVATVAGENLLPSPARPANLNPKAPNYVRRPRTPRRRPSPPTAALSATGAAVEYEGGTESRLVPNRSRRRRTSPRQSSTSVRRAVPLRRFPRPAEAAVAVRDEETPTRPRRGPRRNGAIARPADDRVRRTTAVLERLCETVKGGRGLCTTLDGRPGHLTGPKTV